MGLLHSLMPRGPQCLAHIGGGKCPFDEQWNAVRRSDRFEKVILGIVAHIA